MAHQVGPSIWPISMAHQHGPSVWPISTAHQYSPSVCPISMSHKYFPISMAHKYGPSVWPISMSHQHVPSVFSHQHGPSVWPISIIISFYKSIFFLRFTASIRLRKPGPTLVPGVFICLSKEKICLDRHWQRCIWIRTSICGMTNTNKFPCTYSKYTYFTLLCKHNTPGTIGGLRGHDRTLVVKSRKMPENQLVS